MKLLLGGEEEDALYDVPSPYPPEHLTLYQADIDTRYARREASVDQIVNSIRRLWEQTPCRCMVFFPSFAYLRLVDEALTLPHQTQRTAMTMEDREAFLQPYREGDEPVLSLCVLGGVFS